MFRSAGVRFIIVGVLTLLMFIPLNLVSGVVQERARYSDETVDSISREWGGRQLISGPLLVIPVTEDVTYERKREAVDPVTGRS
ncbi:MAG: inner membrane CreD family protein, partial [Pseudomonadota bacterium]